MKVMKINLSPDFLGAISPMKRVLGFTKREIARTDIGYHYSVTSASERVLEKLSELRVSVGNVLLALDKGVDAAAQR